MRTAKTSTNFLLCLTLFFAALPAQGAPQDNQPRVAVTTDVTIIIEKEKVLLTARQAVEYLQLQILDAAGEVVFDSGLNQGNEIAWGFQNGAGEAVKSGLYAYRLTVKEAGKESAQTRRGHFIVDRAKDRDGGADKLWVTSQNDGGIGADLTVSRNEDGVIAGVGAPIREKDRERAIAHREGKDEATRSKTTDQQALNVAGIGTPGQIARFVSEEEVGDSVITESNGAIGIGTTAPVTKLTVATPTNSYGVSHTDGETALSTWVGTGSTGSGGWFGTLSNHDLNFFTNNGAARMTISKTGSVGVGTSTPKRNLHVHSGGSTSPIVLSTGSGSEGPASFWLQADSGLFGQGRSLVIYDEVARQYRMVINGTGKVGFGTPTPFGDLHIAGYGPVITLESRQNGIYKMAHVQNADGNIVFKPSGFGACCAAMVIRETTGNVGVGTSNPLDKLHVAGNFLRVDGKANEQVYIGGDGVGNDAQLGSSNPSVTDVVLWNNATNRYMKLVASSLTITGGADFAENFDLSGAAMTEMAQPGMVVSIDPAAPGKLALSSQAYDRRVAGVISGAGGVKPGMMMSQEGTMADGKLPVALSGRVFCWADASRGAIEPGDLLTSSATPGHAMKAADAAKAQGAIIGKAMTSLKEGKGLVLVLVTLQ